MSSHSRVPDRPSLDGLEENWIPRWEQEGTYAFKGDRPRTEVYSIDTPPATASGSLHVGHVFSYSQTDVMARFQRMRGKDVFYPIGWDDNGLPTERRVQNYYGVTCDPTLTFDPDFKPPSAPLSPPLATSRKNFVQLCHQLTDEDEVVFAELFRRLGLSVDWTTLYTTKSEHSQLTSQLAFLHMAERGEVYRQESPTLWDIDYQTAVAQAELEDRELAGAYFRLRFDTVGDTPTGLEIETTRPELLPACVALVAHPDDERYKPYFGSLAKTPLFGVEVPIHPHRLAEPDKGTGIAMVCTFGDLTDVTWWRELGLATRTVIGRNGRFGPAAFGEPGWESSIALEATTRYASIEGQTVRAAQKRVVEMLTETGELLGDPRPISHAVKFYEKGDRPLEIVSSRQWYVRTLEYREAFLAAGRELSWHPGFMQARYESWVEGLNGDWNISRQRFFGVPLPVWYRIREDGTIDDTDPIFPTRDQLPIDPLSLAPPGYNEEQRGLPSGFAGDPDVMDTWATSSLTPQIAGHWADNPELFSRVFPMDLRPQAHEIIRTWLFSTVVRSYFEHKTLPFYNAAISGWILDPDRKKMSKSKGNVIVPTELLEQHGTDAVRYWAVSARLGADTVFDEQQMKVGRRLAIKILNATKFVLARLQSDTSRPATLEALDEAMLAQLDAIVSSATNAFEEYEHARALNQIEAFFWTFCDDYLELVKTRAYSDGPGAASAAFALNYGIDTMLVLLAPFLPFATEEAWSWNHEGSIHRAQWPTPTTVVAVEPRPLNLASEVIREIRRAKSVAKRSMKAPVALAVITASADDRAHLVAIESDLIDAGNIATIEYRAGETLEVSVTLGEDDKPGPK